MASNVQVKVTMRVEAQEMETGIGVGAGSSYMRHVAEAALTLENGTAASQCDVVWSASSSVTSGSPATIDMRGSLTSVLTGDAVNFVEVVGFFVKNKSTTAGQTLEIGGGSNSFSTWAGGAGDTVLVGAGGAMYISAPIDGYATTAGTGDILQVKSTTGTVAYDVIVFGRSA